MDSKIKSCFWSDPVVEDLGAAEKLALLWLFTAHISNCGWVPASKRRFEFETASPWQALLTAAQALGEGIVIHEKGFWVRNYIRHQIGAGEKLARNNMRVPICESIAAVPDEIRIEILKEYPQLPQALAKGLGSTREGEGAGEGAGGGAGGGDPPAATPDAKPKAKHFTPPTLDEWVAHAGSLKPTFPAGPAEQAWNYYEANGWRVGKNPMKKWTAAVVTCRGRWIENGSQELKLQQPTKPPSANQFMP